MPAARTHQLSTPSQRVQRALAKSTRLLATLVWLSSLGAAAALAIWQVVVWLRSASSKTVSVDDALKLMNLPRTRTGWIEIDRAIQWFSLLPLYFVIVLLGAFTALIFIGLSKVISRPVYR
jgi:disulfide bond formation protein DsbB